MKSAIRLTGTTLGIYAGILGIEHGVFEVLQGNICPSGMLIDAIGTPCQPDLVWHACYPALTLIPNMALSGILSTGLGLVIILWSATFFRREWGGWLLLLFSFLLLIVGGGFVSTYIGLVAGMTGIRLRVLKVWMHYRPGKMARIFSQSWPWVLILMGIWLPGSWILGYFFVHAMLTLSIVVFLVFDVGLPILAVISGFAHDLIKG